MVNRTSSAQFKGRFIRDLPDDFVWQSTPFQVYPLDVMAQHLILPTPLLQPDYSFLIHLHQGTFTQQLDGNRYVIKAPAILFVGSGTPLSMLSIQEELKGHFLLMENQYTATLLTTEAIDFALTFNPTISLSESASDWIHRLCGLLNEEIQQEPVVYAQTLQSLVLALFAKIRASSQLTASLSRCQQLVLRFKKLIDQHADQERHLHFYAQALSISENYLARCVQQVLAKRAKQLINEVIIQKSQALLHSSSQDIAQISYDLNFDDPSHFSRLFRQVTGQTPSAYRKSILHDLS